MKRTLTLSVLLLLFAGCKISGVYTDKFWTDKFYQLEGDSITVVINKIGTPSEITQIEESEVYLFKSIQKNYLGRSPVCELKLQVSNGIISTVELTGSEGSCSMFKLK